AGGLSARDAGEAVVDLVEDALQSVEGLVEGDGLLGGGADGAALAGDGGVALRADTLEGAAGDRGDENESGRGDGADGAMAADQPPAALRGAGAPGQDGAAVEVAAEVGGEFGGAGVAGFGRLLEGLEEDRVEVGGDAGAEVRGSRWVLA